MSEPRSRSRRLLAAAALALICAISWLHQAHYDFENDDAYISYRYAVQWSQGLGPVFNPGERVEGYSNFLLVAVLALAHRLGFDVVVVSRALGTLAALGIVLLAFRFVSVRFQRGAAWALAGSLGVALHGGLACWARSGMETVPLAFLVLLAQFLFLGELANGRAHWKSGLAFAACALLRADGFVHLAATALFLMVQRSHRRRFWSLLLPFAGVVVPYFLWRFQYYGYLYPNPYYLRTGGDIYQQLRGLFYTANFIVPFGGLLLFAAPLLLFVLRDPARNGARAYLATCVTVFTAYVVWVGGDYMPMARFFIPIVAPLLFLQLEAAAEIVARVLSSRTSALHATPGYSGFVARDVPMSGGQRAGAVPMSSAQRAVFAILASCIVLSGFLPTLNPRRQPRNRATLADVQVEQWTLAGRWLNSNVPKETLLAAEPVGALGYYSQLPIVDMLGVNDEHIAHLAVDNLGHSTAGHEKRDSDYVLSRHPQLIFRGVWPDSTRASEHLAYPDGASYTLRCVSLGPGPVANDLGEVRNTQLFLWYEDRSKTSN